MKITRIEKLSVSELTSLDEFARMEFEGALQVYNQNVRAFNPRAASVDIANKLFLMSKSFFQLLKIFPGLAKRNRLALEELLNAVRTFCDDPQSLKGLPSNLLKSLRELPIQLEELKNTCQENSAESVSTKFDPSFVPPDVSFVAQAEKSSESGCCCFGLLFRSSKKEQLIINEAERDSRYRTSLRKSSGDE